MKIPTGILNPKEERRLLRGHLWAYRNEFKSLPELVDGALIDVFSANRRLVGRGFYQAQGGIGVRLLTKRQEDINSEFFRARIEKARKLRDNFFTPQTTYRWIFGESDGLPGLVADRYDSIVIAQASCAFYQNQLETLAQLFLNYDGVSGVIMRYQDDMQHFGDVPDTVDFQVEGLTLSFPSNHFQKTGLFLDQRLNQKSIIPFVKGARVLDGHCYHGLWSCHAALAGADEVVGVDTSSVAIERARGNAARNGVGEHCRFECAPVEDFLNQQDKYDVVIIDPPAFAKARNQAKKAFRRYQQLNTDAMKCLHEGGILATSSCSHFLDGSVFREMLKQAAATAQRSVTLLEMRGAGPDHPVLLAMPETSYLKCALLRVD